MAGTISTGLIATALSLSLLSPGSVPNSWSAGHDPVAVATVQAELDVLGFNAGPVTGRLTQRFYQGTSNFVTQFGQPSGTSLETQLTAVVSGLPDLPARLSGASVVAIQSWLRSWKLYRGQLNGRMTQSLQAAVQKFQKEVGLPASGGLNGPTLTMMAHLAVVRMAAERRWAYAAEPGDRMSLIAWAAGISLKQLEASNSLHGQILWVGQRVHFHVPTAKKQGSASPNGSAKRREVPALPPTSSVSHHQATAPSLSSPSPALVPTAAPTGVYSNLQPIAAFVLYDPRSQVLTALLAAQKLYPHDLIDIAVTGEWALTHSSLMGAVAKTGNEVIMGGYSGISLNGLPAWGIRQEVSWSQKAVTQTSGQTPVFISQPVPFTASATSVVTALNIIAISPGITLGPDTWGTSAPADLLDHPEGVVGSTFGPGSANGWESFFRTLGLHHFVFLTLGQIWANGG